jgi:hypothetical protein
MFVLITGALIFSDSETGSTDRSLFTVLVMLMFSSAIGASFFNIMMAMRAQRLENQKITDMWNAISGTREAKTSVVQTKNPLYHTPSASILALTDIDVSAPSAPKASQNPPPPPGLIASPSGGAEDEIPRRR